MAINGTVVARWFDNRDIEITQTSAALGGAWQWRDAVGRPLCYDDSIVKLVYEWSLTIDGPVMVDVGASSGNFALLPVANPNLHVHAFEPNPVQFNALMDNVVLNRLEGNVALYPYALADENKDGTLKLPRDPWHAAVACLGDGDPRDRGHDWQEINIPVRRLDDMNVYPGIIKIDVEGAELMVLQGAKDTIFLSNPAILIEYTSLNTRQFGYECEEIKELLEEWGYTNFKRVGMEDLWVTP